jgi:hypothetical protein
LPSRSPGPPLDSENPLVAGALLVATRPRRPVAAAASTSEGKLAMGATQSPCSEVVSGVVGPYPEPEPISDLNIQSWALPYQGAVGVNALCLRHYALRSRLPKSRGIWRATVESHQRGLLSQTWAQAPTAARQSLAFCATFYHFFYRNPMAFGRHDA